MAADQYSGDIEPQSVKRVPSLLTIDMLLSDLTEESDATHTHSRGPGRCIVHASHTSEAAISVWLSEQHAQVAVPRSAAARWGSPHRAADPIPTIPDPYLHRMSALSFTEFRERVCHRWTQMNTDGIQRERESPRRARSCAEFRGRELVTDGYRYAQIGFRERVSEIARLRF
jgi:hypothetical protein